MKTFFNYIKEIFNTINYSWEKKNFQTIAKFSINKKKYKVHFDEVMTNVYNLYFYIDDDRKIFTLMNDNDKHFQVLSNVVNCVEDFMKTHQDMEFLGFSSYEYERNDLYTLFLQKIKMKFEISIIEKKKKSYYFLYDKKNEGMILDLQIKKFILEDDKKKKIF